MLKTKTEIKVRYSETDSMQFVHNPRYYEYFEIGRTEMLRDVGLPYKSIQEKGFYIPVIESKAQYHSPAFYDDIVIIESTLKDLPSVKIHIDYKVIRKSDGTLLAEGYTEHVFIKDSTKKAMRLPEFFLEKIKPYFK
jgi:acyl-CoA thioester hydrolase